ncbi:MAG: DUF3611 family protein [Cyanobacteria bacterium RU_5_0]|nr:DUF3611 family protein [Cyanobacteria bacterium RU_5_0]
MANKSESALSPARIAGALRIIGWLSFWIQIVLGVVSAIILLFAGTNLRAPSPNPNVPTSPVAANPGTGAGLFFAFLGLLALFGSAYWAFRYTRIARKLKTPDRPGKADTADALRMGLIISLIGLLLTILGAQATAGALLLKSFEQGFVVLSGNPLRFITPLDIFVVQANANTIMAHFIGLGATLLLMRSMKIL